jgi:hypothetical protein
MSTDPELARLNEASHLAFERLYEASRLALAEWVDFSASTDPERRQLLAALWDAEAVADAALVEVYEAKAKAEKAFDAYYDHMESLR